MLASIAFTIAALALVLGVTADPVPLEPSSTSVFDEGGNCTILWTPDTTGVWRVMNIELMTGDNFNQVHLKTVGTVDGTDATNPNYSYTCLAVTPNAPIYFYKFSTPASSDILFTTRFTIADAQGNSVPANMTETATDGSIVHYGTGALQDPSQGDQPPVIGTGTGNSTTAAPTGAQTESQGDISTSVPTPSGTGTFTSTASTSTRTSSGSQTYTMSSIALGAFGALVGALFL